MSTASPPSPAPRSSSGALAAWGAAFLVIATVLIGALAPARHGAPVISAADDPACVEWTDGCKVCQRLAEGPACSLPGIACQPGALQCLHRREG
ncbi:MULTISPECIES: hypothetical protein [Methylobacterium]|uniref:hypothetical protein n=1 Tax=Methylobacterium TaxID=407 RepID=UPI001F28BA0F|nr:MULTISPECIES: hypothetical protein [Methylobacterium]UIN37041.1 hypothetical protein LXM90_11315 [Methylobacterium oryzae]WCS27674.1 hypothetical protein LOK46_12890 [Methylobacterium sp. NMS14P]